MHLYNSSMLLSVLFHSDPDVKKVGICGAYAVNKLLIDVLGYDPLAVRSH